MRAVDGAGMSVPAAEILRVFERIARGGLLIDNRRQLVIENTQKPISRPAPKVTNSDRQPIPRVKMFHGLNVVPRDERLGADQVNDERLAGKRPPKGGRCAAQR